MINFIDANKAIDRLLAVARGDTGQSGKVARFLLAWWNAEQQGGFDLTDLWAVDEDIAADMLTFIQYISVVRSYPDSMGYGPQFEEIVQLWGRVKT